MRYKILLVEDSKVVQQMYRNKLTIEQFSVITADNGMDAIKALSQEKPDIILLDLMMPIMDGFKVLQIIKSDPKLKNIPVLVFSAKGQPEEVEKALNLGAEGYIIKATTKPNEVIEKIKSILRQKPKVEESKSYLVEINENSYDVNKLIEDFNLNGLKCQKCNSKLLLVLIPEKSAEGTKFSASFLCPKCEKIS
jgi:DNA-binding response OmpR family regulator